MDPVLAEALSSRDRELADIALRIQRLDNDHHNDRDRLLWEMALTTYRKQNALNFSPVVTIVDAAPDEEAQLEAVMDRLAERVYYDPVMVELAIAAVGPHDTDALVDFLNSLAVASIEHTKTAHGKTLIKCAACEEQLPPKELVLATCGHCYCELCLGAMFMAAMNDESLYPPRCCGDSPISIEHAKKFLDEEFEKEFEKKGVEFATVDRTYCSDPTCSTFIPPETIDRATAHCWNCKKGTCVACKAPAHEGDCPADLELAELLKYAEEMHWQRCFGCLSVVERRDGCSHMDCTCGASFCYICGRSLDASYDHEDHELCSCGGDPTSYRFYKPSTDESKSAESLSETSEAPSEALSVLSDEIEFDDDQDDMDNDEPALPAVEELFSHDAPQSEAVEELSNDAIPTEDNNDSAVTGGEEPGLPGLGKQISCVAQTVARMDMFSRTVAVRERDDLRTITRFVTYPPMRSWPMRNQHPTSSDRPSSPSRPGPHRTLRARLAPHRRLQNQQNADMPEL
ncbi:hypothetical protein KCU93_g5348, partial [Aureobasidium melanogenum]